MLEPGVCLGAAVLARGSARCSHAGRQVDSPRVRVSSPRSRAAAFDLPVFGLADRYVVSVPSPRGCVQTVEWAGRASQAKYSRRRPGTASPERAGGHPCTRMALWPPRCSTPKHGVGDRALNGVEKLPAVGKSIRGKRSSSGTSDPGLSLLSGEARSRVLGRTAPSPNCPLQAQCPHCCASWRTWERRVSVTALGLCK